MWKQTKCLEKRGAAQALSIHEEALVWRFERHLFKNLNLGALGLDIDPTTSLIYPSRCLPFQEAVEAAKIGGFQGVDIDIIEMKKILKSKSVDEVKHLVEGKRLKFGGWGLPVNFYGDEETYRRELERLPEYAQVSEELGCNRVFTWIQPFSDRLPFEENFKFHVKRLKPIAEILQDHGCCLGLEFDGAKTVRINHKYEFIYTMDGIMRLCEAIGTKNLGLLLDSWHWYTSHGTIDELRRLKGEQVIYVHVNDAPAGIPIEEQRNFARCLPGETGVIDLVGFLKALKEIRYEGPVTPESFFTSPLISLIFLVSLPFKEGSSMSREIQRILSSYFWISILKLRIISPRMLFASMYFLKKLREKLKEMPVLEAVRMTGEFLDKVWEEARLSL